MPSFFATLCLFSLVALVSALSSPHAARNIHHRRALAARVPIPVEPNVEPDVGTSSIRRRANAKRCTTRPATTSTSAPAPPINVAPTPDVPSSSHTPAPSDTPHSTPSPTPTPKTTTTSTKPRPSSPPSSNSGGNSNLPSYLVGSQTGQGTWYDTGLGSCGIQNTNSDFIAAVSHLLYDSFPGYKGGNPNNNPVCNKRVKATYQGKSVTVTITDRCTGCAITDLDFSPAAFNTLSDPGVGRISGVEWVWLD